MVGQKQLMNVTQNKDNNIGPKTMIKGVTKRWFLWVLKFHHMDVPGNWHDLLDLLEIAKPFLILGYVFMFFCDLFRSSKRKTSWLEINSPFMINHWIGRDRSTYRAHYIR